MAKSYSRKQIYRMARRYHFERYNSSRCGRGEKYRNYTLVGAGACIMGAWSAATGWRNLPMHDLCLAALAVVGGAFAIMKYGVEWCRYDRLAREFATGAVDGGLVDGEGKELGPCDYTPEGIAELFKARYPWII